MRFSLLLPTTACALALLSISNQKARADVAIVAQEASGGVVITYTGTLRASELAGTASGVYPDTPFGHVSPNFPTVEFATYGNASIDGAEYYGSVVSSRPTSFGTGSTSYPSSFAGDYFGIGYFDVKLPNRYTDNAEITGTMTFNGASFTSMGLTSASGNPYLWILENGEAVTLLIDRGSSSIVDKVELKKKIKKLKAQLKNAKRRKKKGKAKKLKKKLKALKTQLNAL